MAFDPSDKDETPEKEPQGGDDLPVLEPNPGRDDD